MDRTIAKEFAYAAFLPLCTALIIFACFDAFSPLARAAIEFREDV